MRRVPVLAAVAALLAVLFAHAAAAGTAVSTPAGWTVDRVRFTALDPAKPVGAIGIGDYRGSLEVGRSPATGGLAVLNAVGIDDYLRGISEVPASWPLEAQKAQAIAARTYLLSEVASTTATPTRAAGAHICATDACQVYAGIAKERRPGSELWNAAVAQTAGQVLLHRGAPIVAKYSSSNGGATVGGGRPYLRGGIADPFDAASPLHRWRVSYPLATVQSALGLAAPPVLVGAYRDGGVVVLEHQGEDGSRSTTRLSAVDFRKRMVGAVAAPAGLPQAIPSMRYSMTTDGATGSVVIDGGGWGHGIGMSQWGAFGRAQRGWQAPDILAAYYAGLRPVALRPEQLPRQVRVALALGRPDATVTSVGAFQVSDGKGRVLAHAASGAWRVVPAGNGVRVIPPADQAGPAAVEPLGVEGGDRPGAAPTVRFRVSTPAAVRVAVAPPGATVAQELDAGIVLADGTVALPAPAAPGAYRLELRIDAGAGRTAVVPLSFAVVDPSAAAATAGAPSPVTQPLSAWAPLTGGGDDEEERLPGVLVGLATVVLAMSTGATLRLTRRR